MNENGSQSSIIKLLQITFIKMLKQSVNGHIDVLVAWYIQRAWNLCVTPLTPGPEHGFHLGVPELYPL